VEGVREKSFARHVQATMKKPKVTLLMIMRGTMYFLSLSLLVFLRRGFGERMASDLCMACGFAWFCSWLYATVGATVLASLPESRFAPFFLYALSAVTALHLLSIWLWRTKPATIQSFSTGRPIGFWRILRLSDAALQRYVQPAACALTALWLARWDRPLAYWIGAASFAVFIEEQLARFGMRRRVLDTIDGRIDSQVLYGKVQERLAPVSAAATQATVVEVAEPSRRKTGKLKSIMARLDPELRKMLEPTTATGKEKPQ